MNKTVEGKKKSVFPAKTKETLIVCGLAAILLVSSWQVFSTKESDADNVYSNSERKVERLLEQMEGVGDTEVVICQMDGGVKSVVVVCEGGNDLQVIMRVREAVAAALGMEEKAVKIYVKKV